IRRTVAKMLQYLRFPDKRQRFLWIDALCVSQDDYMEKEKQVNRMGSIYREAKRVLIWLGQEEEYDDR
ncbi:hypothetical protein P154DRAFT_417563, partial [Amniculicola lignicola CBS 123094]